jgi:hypothetical protein
MTDEIFWINQAQQGNDKAFTILAETYQKPIYNLCYRMLGDPEVVGRGLAKLVGKTRPVIVSGAINSIQLWMSYHLRFQMGKLMSMMAEKARQNQ